MVPKSIYIIGGPRNKDQTNTNMFFLAMSAQIWATKDY